MLKQSRPIYWLDYLRILMRIVAVVEWQTCHKVVTGVSFCRSLK